MDKRLVVSTGDLGRPKKNRDFFEELATVMSNEEFRKFFTEYFGSWDDIKAIMMIMKTYEYIDSEYQERTGGKMMEPSKIADVMRAIMKKHEFRKIMVEGVNEFMDNRQKFKDTYRKYLAIEGGQDKGV